MKLFRDRLSIFLIAYKTDVVLAPIYGQRTAFAGRKILMGVSKDLIAALFALVVGIDCHGFVWHMVSIIPEGE